jgi:eukaryotic translation initiation factor 2C
MPLQGTGRSAHYFVLKNEMRLSSDVLQQITHATCYIYARATKEVSYCAPAYYVDRLCDRGRAWFREYLTGHRSVVQQDDEDPDDFKQRALDHINQDVYWRPLTPATLPHKYGAVRKNPWHQNLDNIMFYL